MTTTSTTTWFARAASTLAAVFLVFDAIVKFTHLAVVTDATTQLGIPLDLNPTIGGLLLACVALYVVPPTAALGAVLLTGYLGGAAAMHLRVGNPLASHTSSPSGSACSCGAASTDATSRPGPPAMAHRRSSAMTCHHAHHVQETFRFT